MLKFEQFEKAQNILSEAEFLKQQDTLSRFVFVAKGFQSRDKSQNIEEKDIFSSENLNLILVDESWDLQGSVTRLASILKWRRGIKNHSSCRIDDLDYGYYISGVDKFFRSILWIKPGPADPTKGFLLSTFDSLVHSLPEEVNKFTIIVDYSSLTKTTAPTLPCCREFIQTLDSYIHRLSTLIIINPTWYFFSFSSLIKPFVSAKFVEKIKIVELQQPQGQIIERDIVGRLIGGFRDCLEDFVDKDQVHTVFT